MLICAIIFVVEVIRMSKNKQKVIFLISLLSLFGCDAKNKITIPSIELSNSLLTSTIDESNIADYTIDIDAPHIKEKIENKETFFLYFHSPFCGSCEELKPLMIRYIKESKAAIYSLNTTKVISVEPGPTPETSINITNLSWFQKTGNNVLDANNNEIFCFSNGECEATPALMTFKDGKYISKQYGTDNLLKYKVFKRFMNNHLSICNTKTIISNVNDYEKENNIIYYFKNDSTNKISLYSQILVNNIDMYLYDTSLYSSTIESKIVNYKNNTEILVNDSTTIENIMSFI